MGPPVWKLTILQLNNHVRGPAQPVIAPVLSNAVACKLVRTEQEEDALSEVPREGTFDVRHPRTAVDGARVVHKEWSRGAAKAAAGEHAAVRTNARLGIDERAHLAAIDAWMAMLITSPLASTSV